MHFRHAERNKGNKSAECSNMFRLVKLGRRTNAATSSTTKDLASPAATRHTSSMYFERYVHMRVPLSNPMSVKKAFLRQQRSLTGTKPTPFSHTEESKDVSTVEKLDLHTSSPPAQAHMNRYMNIPTRGAIETGCRALPLVSRPYTGSERYTS